MDLEGTLIGDRYLLETQIGEGGMGSVWRATDRTLERPVAVKVLYSGDERDRELRVSRFLREARIAAAVQHRNVVHIVDFGSTDEGRPYMVMEHLKGETLSDRLARSPAPTVDEVVGVIVSTLAGLAAAHDAGVVHRDVKPENIFLVDDTDGVFPKILDFGISRSLQPQSGPRSALTTREGFLVGTPQYMSPEQARGLEGIDHRTDLYSVGVILYEALTGRLPAESDNIGDLIILIAAGGAPMVSEVRPELGEALGEVVRKALSVDPDARYEDARAMRTALVDARDRTDASTLALPAKSRRRRSGLPPAPDKPSTSARTVGDRGASETAAALAKTLPARKAKDDAAPPPALSVETPSAWTVSEEPPRSGRGVVIGLLVAGAIGAAIFVLARGHDEPEAGHAASPPAVSPDPDAGPALLASPPAPEVVEPISDAPDAGARTSDQAAVPEALPTAPPTAPEPPRRRVAERPDPSRMRARMSPASMSTPPATLRQLDY